MRLSIGLLAVASLFAQSDPDLQGVWTNATFTPIERPPALAAKATVSDACVKRTALIVDPPDGKIPSTTPEAKQRNATRFHLRTAHDAGPLQQQLPEHSDPDYVMILVEMVHNVRVIRMNGAHAPQGDRQWLGDSGGHWEGDTLVVDTTNLTDKTRYRGSSDNLHVTERFTKV